MHLPISMAVIALKTLLNHFQIYKNAFAVFFRNRCLLELNYHNFEEYISSGSTIHDLNIFPRDIRARWCSGRLKSIRKNFN